VPGTPAVPVGVRALRILETIAWSIAFAIFYIPVCVMVTCWASLSVWIT
jgi:hypothetical protein